MQFSSIGNVVSWPFCLVVLLNGKELSGCAAASFASLCQGTDTAVREPKPINISTSFHRFSFSVLLYSTRGPKPKCGKRYPTHQIKGIDPTTKNKNVPHVHICSYIYVYYVLYRCTYIYTYTYVGMTIAISETHCRPLSNYRGPITASCEVLVAKRASVSSFRGKSLGLRFSL